MMLSKSDISDKNKSIKKEEENLQKKVSTNNYIEASSINSNNGNEKDWLELKAEIDNLLQTNTDPSILFQKNCEITNYWNKVRVQRRKSISTIE